MDVFWGCSEERKISACITHFYVCYLVQKEGDTKPCEKRGRDKLVVAPKHRLRILTEKLYPTPKPPDLCQSLHCRPKYRTPDTETSIRNLPHGLDNALSDVNQTLLKDTDNSALGIECRT